MDRVSGIFVDGMGTAAATSGILTQLQGRIFGLLYLQERPLSLDEITDELQQSKSNVSVQIRGLLDWQLVRQLRVPGSRRDHYQAATDFWRVMQAIVERRFRWNLRQVLATADETERARASKARRGRRDIVQERLSALRAYFLAVDDLLGALSMGEPMTSMRMHEVATTMSPLQEAPKPGTRPRQRPRLHSSRS
jgi:DNA-binding transcriptional regulator GbsR (MarR family)